MYTITEIRQTSSERFVISFNDESELHSTKKVITDQYVFTGKELSEKEYLDLVNESRYSLCESRALKMLTYQPLSKKKLKDKLIQKGELEDDACRAVDWLEEMGMLNDSLFAEMVVRHYSAKGYGKKRIENELYRHGVPRELWEEAMEELPCQNDKIDSFIRSRLTDPNDKKQIKRVTDGLFRRGFSWEDIKPALDRFKDEYEDATE